MRNGKLSIGLRVALTIVAAAQFAAATRAFGSRDGAYPAAGLIRDAKGNLYGTTTGGGNYAGGTVFVLTLKAGVWAQHILHNFNSQDRGGDDPYSNLIFDRAGNLYGTTMYGGAHPVGTVFELKRPPHGVVWTEKVLYSFAGGSDGSQPFAGVISDAAGNLYGTTWIGGNSGCNSEGCGTVFQLALGTDGKWREALPHIFDNNGTDGDYPRAGLVLDGSGNLYGTTFYGGTYGYGTVFELTPTLGGGWAEAVLYNFSNTDGANPAAGLLFDGDGNMYGTTANGGAYGYGTVFELTPAGGGSWTEAVLHSFNNTDGANPAASLIFDSVGNLYGTTSAGGAYGYGTALELSPAAGGSWTETVLHHFGNGKDGGQLYGGLIFDRSGNLYGTTNEGGVHRYGTVFELTPTAGGGWTEKVLHNFNVY